VTVHIKVTPNYEDRFWLIEETGEPPRRAYSDSELIEHLAERTDQELAKGPMKEILLTLKPEEDSR
jgi:hypothetical protein